LQHRSFLVTYYSFFLFLIQIHPGRHSTMCRLDWIKAEFSFLLCV
jgi:hypothetical protein